MTKRGTFLAKGPGECVMNVYVYGKIFSEKTMEIPKCILSVKLNSFPKGTFEDDFPFPKMGEMDSFPGGCRDCCLFVSKDDPLDFVSLRASYLQYLQFLPTPWPVADAHQHLQQSLSYRGSY